MKTARTMRMSALEDRSGCTRDTIHFYLRSGLLHPPRKTGATAALYDATHVDRLARIRALRDAGVPLDRIAGLLDALAEAPLASLHAVGLVIAHAGDASAAGDPSGALDAELLVAFREALARVEPELEVVSRRIAAAVADTFDPRLPDRSARLLETLRSAITARMQGALGHEVTRAMVVRATGRKRK